MADIDDERIWFLRGALAALASTGQVVHYNEIRRLCRFAQEQLGTALGAAREGLSPDEPDFCAIVVNDGGWPGTGFGQLERWPADLRKAHSFWRDRRQMDNTEFQQGGRSLPTFPGLPGER